MRALVTVRNDGGGHTRRDGSHGSRAQRSATPLAFRDVLLGMARTAGSLDIERATP